MLPRTTPEPGGTVQDRPLFRDRIEAGRALAERLAQYRGKDVLVLGIPRGGVPVAAEVARCLDGGLDVIVARKLGAPISAELAIGAVTANGGRFLNEEIIRELGVSEAYLNAVTDVQMREAREREARLRSLRPASPVEHRIVIVVDDGLATGATMRAAVRSVRQKRPARVVVAVPVGAAEACTALRAEADEVVCPYQPEPFGAIGWYYEHFEPTEDVQVQELLEEAHARTGADARFCR